MLCLVIVLFLLLSLVTQTQETAVIELFKHSQQYNPPQKNLFGIHAAPIFRHDAHEHDKVARKTPHLWKWHKPRSTCVQLYSCPRTQRESKNINIRYIG